MSSWIKRKDTKVVHVGAVAVGGYNPISIQSMTNTNTKDIVSTVKQINDLDVAGADIGTITSDDNDLIEVGDDFGFDGVFT